MVASVVVARTRAGASLPPTRPVEPPWESVRELYQILRGVTREALGPHGLLLSEYQALALCAPGPVPLKSITRALDVTPAATTDLARRLQRRRLIRLSPHPTDHRSRLAVLTEPGRRLLREAKDAQRKALRELGARVSPAARDGLLGGVAELRQALRKTGDD